MVGVVADCFSMRRTLRALLVVVVGLLATAGSCNGPEEGRGYPFVLDPAVLEAAQERGLDATDWIIERKDNNGEWAPSVGVSDGSALADTHVVDDCSTLGEMRVKDPDSGSVLALLKDPICFTGPYLSFVITLDMIDWPESSE